MSEKPIEIKIKDIKSQIIFDLILAL